MIWIAVVAIVVVVGLVVVLAGKRRPEDGVDSFRRQIDALSSDARRPIVGRLNQVAHGRDDTPAGRTGTDRPGTDRTGTDSAGTDGAGTDSTGTDGAGTDGTGTDGGDDGA